MNIKYAIAVAGIAIFACLPASRAGENGPNKAFDASYQVKTQGASSTMRMACDGKGHLRSENSSGGYSVVSLIDYNEMTQTSLIPQSKMAMKSKLKQEGVCISDEESAKKANAKALGTKVIGGHPCHGWSYKNAAGTTEIWTGDDTGCFVLSTSTSSAGKTVTELKSFSKVAPGPDQFKVPAGYKYMQM